MEGRKAVQTTGDRKMQPRERPGFVLQAQARVSQDTQRLGRGDGEEVTLHFALPARAKELRRSGEEATASSHRCSYAIPAIFLETSISSSELSSACCSSSCLELWELKRKSRLLCACAERGLLGTEDDAQKGLEGASRSTDEGVLGGRGPYRGCLELGSVFIVALSRAWPKLPTPPQHPQPAGGHSSPQPGTLGVDHWLSFTWWVLSSQRPNSAFPSWARVGTLFSFPLKFLLLSESAGKAEKG